MQRRFLFIVLFILPILPVITAAQQFSREITKPNVIKNDSREEDRAAIRASIKDYFNKDSRKTDSLTLKDYNLVELEILFQGETALVCFAVNIEEKKGDKTISDKLRMLDVYSKQNGKWIPNASNIIPQKSAFTLVSPEARKIILEQREKVWQAWFKNDKPLLEKAIPEEIVVISPGQENFKHRSEILESSERFVKSGGKLIRLEFPKDEIQVYGSTIILYTTYLYEVELNGKKEISAGRATDMFVLRDNAFVNVGWHLDFGK